MPFPFRFICDLLQQLDDELRSAKKQKTSSRDIIEAWFRVHRERLDAPTVDASAVLSTLLPERRTDRVYGIQALKLEGIIGNALCLGSTRLKQLRRYKIAGEGLDLADCVENILTGTPNARQKVDVTVEEIDDALHRLASICRFSSPAVRAAHGVGKDRATHHELDQFYQRLGARDAKWLTRLVLKTYEPVVLDERVVLRAYHVLLPQILSARADFSAAATLLRDVIQSGEPLAVADILRPVLGTKIGRQMWLKGRSIKHCTAMIGGRNVSCEQKLDGEYCQIHIDLRKSPLNAIQIFSKSGKDSTQDRKRLHSAIRDSLRLGADDCPLSTGCILEGELVVYSTKHNRILPFHKIRKHVSRSGSFLGTQVDSQRHEHEHLMIIFYDLLMVDGESLLNTRHSRRFERLEELITPRNGYAEIVKRRVIPFGHRDAATLLRKEFANCIVSRGEGLVLKPDDPYVNFIFGPQTNRYSSCVIKLKKEYIQGWGDVGDFAVVGGLYDAAKAKAYGIPNLKYTHFFIGCIQNRDRAKARTEQPRFIVTNIVELPEALMKVFRTHCNPVAVPLVENNFIALEYRGIGFAKEPTYVFPDPPVFDMRCFSFNKEPNSRTWSMRFPAVSKIHFDRSYLDVMAFDELQEAAQAATELPEEEDSQEMRRWVSRLEEVDYRGKVFESGSQASQNSGWAASVASTSGSTPSSTDDQRPGPSRPTATDEALTDAGVSVPLATCTRPSAVGRGSVPVSDPTDTAAIRASGGRKRRRESAVNSASAKKARRHSGLTRGPIPSNSSPGGPPASPAKRREPLEAIDGNNTIVRQRSDGTTLLESDATPAAVSGCCSSPPTSAVRPTRQVCSSPVHHGRTTGGSPGSRLVMAGDQPSQGHAGCSYVRGEATCAFARCSFLLSPCISQYAWVADLLHRHGVREFAVNPATWASPPSSGGMPVPAISSIGTAGAAARSRARRICLVESQRPGATNEFVQTVEAAGLKRRNGQREWVSVYDWRILEDMAKVDSGALGRGPDPWRARYVGIA